MPRLKWEKETDGRICCFSSNKKEFFGSYCKTNEGWYAHFCLTGYTWYIREFPEGTSEKEVKMECGKFINHFKEEKVKWLED